MVIHISGNSNNSLKHSNEQQKSAEFQILVFGHVTLRHIPEEWNP
jgi:predicted phosphodiesterase